MRKIHPLVGDGKGEAREGKAGSWERWLGIRCKFKALDESPEILWISGQSPPPVMTAGCLSEDEDPGDTDPDDDPCPGARGDRDPPQLRVLGELQLRRRGISIERKRRPFWARKMEGFWEGFGDQERRGKSKKRECDILFRRNNENAIYVARVLSVIWCNFHCVLKHAMPCVGFSLSRMNWKAKYQPWKK